MEAFNKLSDDKKVVKSQVRTGVERFFLVGIILSLLATFFIFFSLRHGGVPLRVSTFTLLCFILLYRFTSGHYVLDLINKNLRFHFAFFGFSWTRDIADFSMIHAVTVNTDHYKSRGGGRGFFDYWTEVVLADGKVIAISERIQNDKTMPTALAKIVAANSSAEYVQDLHITNAKVIRKPNGRYSFSRKEDNKDPELVAKIFAMLFLIFCVSMVGAFMYKNW